MIRLATRSLLSIAIGVLLTAVPLWRVAACDCALTALPDAIRDADVAVVGRLAGHGTSAEFGPMPAESEWTWQVERTRSEMAGDRLSVLAMTDDGANCGVTFEAGERWLVLAVAQDGRLRTNGCMQNHPMDGSDPEAEALIAELVALRVVAAEKEDGLRIPIPMLVVISALGGLAAAGLLAFRGTAGARDR